MRYLECRYDRSGYGTYIRAQIKTNLYDYYIVYDGFDAGLIDPSKIIYREFFLNSRMEELKKEDVVVFTCNDLEGLPGIEKSNCIKLLTLHDITPLKAKYLLKVQKRKWRNIVKRAVEVCDYIITVSYFSKKEIQEEFNIPEHKIFVVYSYAQNVREKLDYNEINQVEYIDRLKNAQYVVSAVASMNLNKNFIRVALAWKNSRYYNRSVMIAMSKKNSMAFKVLLTLLGIKNRVVVPGYVSLERLSSLYYISDLFIFTTLREGFGVPPLEAMEIGTPVLTSNMSCMEEVLGGAAVFVNPYKIKDITMGINQLLDNERLTAELIEKGKVRAKMYSPDRFYNEMLHIFMGIMRYQIV